MSESMDVLGLAEAGSSVVGRARLEQDEPITAGEMGTWRLIFTVGAAGVAMGGRVRIDTDSDTDWGWPQFDDPAGEEYTTLQAPDDAEVALRAVDHSIVELVVTGRPLSPGEELAVTYGDTSGGGPGSRAQTFFEGQRRFWITVDARADGEFTPIADTPQLRIQGGDASRVVVVAPSDTVAGEPFRVLVKAEDPWGNPAERYRGRVSLSAAGIQFPESDLYFAEADHGVKTIEGCQVTEPGSLTITAADERAGLQSQSNPITAHEQPPQYRLLWGDPHGGQVVAPNKIGDFFRYARDVSGIHFAGFQRNDHSMTSPAYAIQQRTEREYYEPGRFVPLPGFEWSGDLEWGGHHNVYFRRFDQPIRRSSHRSVADRSDENTDLNHVQDLYQAYRHHDVVITPHVGGVHADLTFHDPDLEPAVEVTSTHGSFEWILRETIERRYKMGFVGGSDCYTGRPGDDRPGHQLRRYAKGGLTGVYATEHTLEGVLDAIKARRCFATTGHRIAARISGDGHWMGSEYTTSQPPDIAVDASGTAPIEFLEVYRGLTLVHRHDPPVMRSRNRVRILWEGASRRSSYSGVVWDGIVKLSDAKLGEVGTLRFDSPRSHIAEQTEDAVSWHSWTCGYRSGLILDLEPSGDASLEIQLTSRTINGARFGGHGEAPPQRVSFAPADRVRMDVKLSDLASGPRRIDLGLLNRALTVELVPEEGPAHAEIRFQDPDVEPGINPYWAKIVQSDQEMAWTSPVFVDYAPDPLGRDTSRFGAIGSAGSPREAGSAL